MKNELLAAILVLNFSEFTFLVQTESQPTIPNYDHLFPVTIIYLIKCLVC